MSKPTWSTEIKGSNPAHTRIAVYNRGGLSGVLVVNTSDADDLIARLAAPEAPLALAILAALRDSPEAIDALAVLLAPALEAE